VCVRVCIYFWGGVLEVQYGNVEGGKRMVLIRCVYMYVSMYTYVYIVRNILSGTMDGLNQVYTYVVCVCVCVCVNTYIVYCA